MYPFERFTERAKKVLTFAQEEAERSHHSYIGTEHLLLGLLREREGLAGKVLDNLGVEIGKVRETIESVIERNERIIIQQIIPTSRVKKVIEISFEEARRMGHNYVGTEHLLLGLLIEGEGIAAHVLNDLGVSLEEPSQDLRAYHVGERVLVHDPDRPYRLWEGRVASVDGPQLEIAVPGRSAGELMSADAKRIHRVPMSWTRDCPYCQSA